MSDEIENYYEHLVFSRLEEQLTEMGKSGDVDYLNDVACVALNQLPPRYIRHPIDATFYITPAESQQMDLAVEKAISEAIAFIDKRKDQLPDGGGHKS